MIVLVDENYRRSDVLQDNLALRGHQCVVINYIHPNNVCLLALASVIILDAASLHALAHEIDLLCNNRDDRTIIVVVAHGCELPIDIAMNLSAVASTLWVADRAVPAELMALVDIASGGVGEGYQVTHKWIGANN